ncbi:hypothetical protein SBV42_00375 [Chlamydia crocodili]|uniref:Inner membrane protein n=1 Tax=Chlamydia crocodili TaxID=2766982 RepID=A0ABX8CHB8_9CHLA|nr:hypothetical protein [Chlamydia crocodili]QVE49225.1 hypothetical protein H9Q19_00745 [Chlamydia crocodili]
MLSTCLALAACVAGITIFSTPPKFIIIGGISTALINILCLCILILLTRNSAVNLHRDMDIKLYLLSQHYRNFIDEHDAFVEEYNAFLDEYQLYTITETITNYQSHLIEQPEKGSKKMRNRK